MDSNGSYSLIPLPLPAEQRALIPLASPFVIDAADGAADETAWLAWLWLRFRQLCWLLFLTLVIIRRLRRQLLELRQQAGYWQALHQRAVYREDQLAAEIQRLQGELRELKRRAFGRRSETTAATTPQNPTAAGTKHKRPRGQRPGAKGHGRRHHEQLPPIHENCDLADDQRCCPQCQLPFEPIPGTADGDILEIEVRGYRRR